MAKCLNIACWSFPSRSEDSLTFHHSAYRSGNSLTIRTVSTLTLTTYPTSRTIYSGSSARFGSDLMPLHLSSLTWYWSITHSRALRLPRQYWKVSGGIPASLSDALTTTVVLSLLSRILSSTRYDRGTPGASSHLSGYSSTCS